MAAANDLLWPKYFFERLNNALIEFVAHIEQQDESEVEPMTLKNYTLGLQRRLKTRFCYGINNILRKVFSNPFIKV